MRSGTRDAAAILERMRAELTEQQLAIDYVALADPDTLAAVQRVDLRTCRLGYRCCWCVRCDDGRVTTYKISGHCLEAIILRPRAHLVIYRDVLALDVTAFTESMEESGHINFVSAG